MYDLLVRVFEALGPWPVVQFAAAGLFLYVGLRAIQRGEKDKKPNVINGNGLPPWTQYGPVHDVMHAVHEMNEQSRKQIDLLERLDHGLQACKITLELIRNESKLR